MPNIWPIISLVRTIARKKLLDNGIKIYNSNAKRKAYTSLVIEFLSLRKDDKFMKMSVKE